MLFKIKNENKLFWSGAKLAYRPEEVKFPDGIGNIKCFGACFRAFAVVNEN